MDKTFLENEFENWWIAANLSNLELHAIAVEVIKQAFMVGASLGAKEAIDRILKEQKQLEQGG